MPNGDSEIIDGIAKSAECGHEVEITLSKICNKILNRDLSPSERSLFLSPIPFFELEKVNHQKNFLTRTADVRVAF